MNHPYWYHVWFLQEEEGDRDTTTTTTTITTDSSGGDEQDEEQGDEGKNNGGVHDKAKQPQDGARDIADGDAISASSSSSTLKMPQVRCSEEPRLTPSQRCCYLAPIVLKLAFHLCFCLAPTARSSWLCPLGSPSLFLVQDFAFPPSTCKTGRLQLAG